MARFIRATAPDSLLCVLTEDGSMPKDAEPLDAEQIQLIRRWVDQGARLDVAADPDQPLIRMMPRVRQLDPPETYRVPIPVTSLAVHPDDRLLASSGYHEVLLWSLPEGRLVRRITNVAERGYGLTFHPDGQRLAVASGTPGRLGEVKLFHVPTGELLADVFVSEDAMFAVSFSPDGQRLAAGGAEGLVVLIDLASAEKRKPLLINSHSDWVNDVAWSPDGRFSVTASRDKTAKVLDAATGAVKITFNGHAANVTSVRFLADGEHVASIGHDRRLRVWRVADAKETKIHSGFDGDLNHLELLSTNRIVAAGGSNQVFLRQVSDDKVQQEFLLGEAWLSSLAVTPDGSTIVTGDQSGVITLWNLQAKEPLTTWRALPEAR